MTGTVMTGTVTTTQLSSTEAPPRPVKRAGRGTLTRVGDIHVLSLAGSPYEMGVQHGRLMAREIAEGSIPYYRQIIEKLMGRSLGPLSPLAWGALQTTLGRQVARGLPDFARETIRGIAEGSGLDAQTFLDGCTMPDSMMWAAARMMQLRGHGPAVAHRINLGLGCTARSPGATRPRTARSFTRATSTTTASAPGRRPRPSSSTTRTRASATCRWRRRASASVASPP